jgi:hypothetical protein
VLASLPTGLAELGQGSSSYGPDRMGRGKQAAQEKRGASWARPGGGGDRPGQKIEERFGLR